MSDPGNFPAVDSTSTRLRNGNPFRTRNGLETHALILPNCNFRERCNRWTEAYLPPSGRGVGCGINVLRFMSEISGTEVGSVMPLFDTSQFYSQGMPFSEIVRLISFKLNRTPGAIQIFQKPGHTQQIDEIVIQINNKQNIRVFFEQLDLYMPEDSCILIKLNRDPNRDPDGYTSGHYIVIGKENNQLITFDPLLSTSVNPVMRAYTPPPSDNFVRAWNEQHYVTASFVGLQYIPIQPQQQPRIGGGSEEDVTVIDAKDIKGVVFIPEKIVDEMIDALIKSIECKNEPKGGKRIRRIKRTRRIKKIRRIKKTNKKRRFKR